MFELHTWWSRCASSHGEACALTAANSSACCTRVRALYSHTPGAPLPFSAIACAVGVNDCGGAAKESGAGVGAADAAGKLMVSRRARRAVVLIRRVSVHTDKACSRESAREVEVAGKEVKRAAKCKKSDDNMDLQSARAGIEGR